MEQLKKGLKNKNAVIGIIGLGYVGLPLAVAFGQAGLKVIGFDIQKVRVNAINQGKSFIADTKSEVVSRLVKSGNLEATTDQSRLKEVNAASICVPTPLNKAKEPDLSYVIHESENVAKYLQPGQLIILESTTYPGTTREVVMPILERSGLKAGKDFYLAYSPERVDPGNEKFGVKNTPKLVGGIDAKSTELAALLYGQVADKVLSVSSPDVAEMSKVFENVFRNVNIALVNELSWLCENMGISVWEVIEAASSKPFGYMPFYPGPGVGGHCIPLDPYYLANKAREYDFHTRFIELAAGINEQMPSYVTSRVLEALNTQYKSLKGAKVLVLGVAYKKDVEDLRESPVLKLIEHLEKKGAEVSYHDPYVKKLKLENGETFNSVELTDRTISSSDCVVIATDHSIFDYKHIAEKAKLVFDTRGATRGINKNSILRLGE